MQEAHQETNVKGDLAGFVHSRRVDMGMKVSELAARIHTTPQTVYCIERGSLELARKETRLAVAKALKVDPEFLTEIRERHGCLRMGRPLSSGSSLAKHRSAKGWTQGELAEKAGVGLQSLVRLEHGVRLSQPWILFAVKAALGIGPSFAEVHKQAMLRSECSWARWERKKLRAREHLHFPIWERLSAGTYKRLRDVGLVTLRDVYAHTVSELLCIPKFGRGALREVEKAVAFYGLSLWPETGKR